MSHKTNVSDIEFIPQHQPTLGLVVFFLLVKGNFPSTRVLCDLLRFSSSWKCRKVKSFRNKKLCFYKKIGFLLPAAFFNFPCGKFAPKSKKTLTKTCDCFPKWFEACSLGFNQSKPTIWLQFKVKFNLSYIGVDCDSMNANERGSRWRWLRWSLSEHATTMLQ